MKVVKMLLPFLAGAIAGYFARPAIEKKGLKLPKGITHIFGADKNGNDVELNPDAIKG